MKLEEAQKIADSVIAQLSPACERVQVVGSIRRQRADIRDIDILIIPGKNLFKFQETLQQLFGLLTANGPKIKRGQVTVDGIEAQVDLYISDEKTWGTLLLIRTGSSQHNIRLTSIAKSKKLTLKASGLGLVNEKQEVIASDERSIFETLGVPYLPPEARDPEAYLGMWDTLRGIPLPPHD